MKQKFHHGDLVRVAAKLSSCMEHFEADCNAIVIGSYHDQYGGTRGSDPDYTIFIENRGEASWYPESTLTFVRHAPELLETWEEQLEAKSRDYQDLKWIKAHWAELVKAMPSSVMLTLMDLFGVETSFRRNGEYYCLWSDWDEAFPIINAVLSSESYEAALGKFDKPTDELKTQLTSVWNELAPLAP